MRKIFPFLLVVYACQPAKESGMSVADQGVLRNSLVGEWRNTYIKVTMNSVNNIEDSTYVLEADSTNWVDVLKLKPIRTFFEEDGTYHSDHYAPDNTLVFSAKGTWDFSGDTLRMKQTSPNTAQYRLKATIENATVTFSGMLDFDEDGVEDDVYYGTQRRYPTP